MNPFSTEKSEGLQYSTVVNAGGSSVRFTGNTDLQGTSSPCLEGLHIFIMCTSGQWIE